MKEGILRGLAGMLGMFGATVFAVCLPALPGSTFRLPVQIAQGFVMMIAALGMLAVACIPFGLVYALFRRDKRALRGVAGLVLVGAGLVAGLKVGWIARGALFARLANTAQPLVVAIERFRAETGRSPSDLAELVPRYIGEVPPTGMIGYGPFEYREQSEHPQAAGYELRVPCGSGMNWDVFVYWSSGDYPKLMYGGGVERMGGWAYVHE